MIRFQTLHDNDSYWNESTGLSDSGKEVLSKIIKYFNLNKSDFEYAFN